MSSIPILQQHPAVASSSDPRSDEARAADRQWGRQLVAELAALAPASTEDPEKMERNLLAVKEAFHALDPAWRRILCEAVSLTPASSPGSFELILALTTGRWDGVMKYLQIARPPREGEADLYARLSVHLQTGVMNGIEDQRAA